MDQNQSTESNIGGRRHTARIWSAQYPFNRRPPPPERQRPFQMLHFQGVPTHFPRSRTRQRTWGWPPKTERKSHFRGANDTRSLTYIRRPRHGRQRAQPTTRAVTTNSALKFHRRFFDLSRSCGAGGHPASYTIILENTHNTPIDRSSPRAHSNRALNKNKCGSGCVPPIKTAVHLRLVDLRVSKYPRASQLRAVGKACRRGESRWVCNTSPSRTPFSGGRISNG